MRLLTFVLALLLIPAVANGAWMWKQKTDGSMTFEDGSSVALDIDSSGRSKLLGTQPVTLTGDTTISAASHAGKVILLGEVGGNAKLSATLPAATGSGVSYKFIISVANTAEYEIQVTTTDIFDGYMTVIDGNLQTTINAVFDYTAADSDTMNLDSDGICGDVGDWVEVTDILSGVWAVKGACRSDGDAYTTVWAAEIGA